MPYIDPSQPNRAAGHISFSLMADREHLFGGIRRYAIPEGQFILINQRCKAA